MNDSATAVHRFDIQRDYPAGKQIVTVAIAAVVVTGRVLDGR